MNKLRYFVYMIATKKIISKPFISNTKAQEFSDHFNEARVTTNVGYGDYNSETKEYSNIHYAKKN